MPTEFKTIERVCRCGEALVLKNTRDVERKRYCSRRCRQLARWERGEPALVAAMAKATIGSRFVAKPPKVRRVCKHCAQLYLPTSARQLWCAGCCPSKTARNRMQRYGISQPDFDARLKAQDYVCLVCREREPVVVDHDHACCPGTKTCGKCVRGLLCNRCNVLLGVIEEDVALLTKALNYLS